MMVPKWRYFLSLKNTGTSCRYNGRLFLVEFNYRISYLTIVWRAAYLSSEKKDRPTAQVDTGVLNLNIDHLLCNLINDLAEKFIFIKKNI